MNVVSDKVVECLGLKIVKHPTPYRISWVNESSSVPVTARCYILVREKYSDEPWCDVIPMTMCHMLLGRPWMFDRQAICDCYKNSYLFLLKGKKMVLNLLKMRDFAAFQSHKPQEEFSLLAVRPFPTLVLEEKFIFFGSIEARKMMMATFPWI